MNLDTRVVALNRVGKTVGDRFKRLGIVTVQGLLWHFPFRYEDFRTICPIADLEKHDQATILGTLQLIATKRSPRKHTILTEAVVGDASGTVRVVWFGQPFIGKTLEAGDQIFLSGKVSRDRFGVSMMGPMYEKYDPNKKPTHTARLVPIYPSTGGLTQKQIRFLLSQAITVAHDIPDWLPEDILKKIDLPPLSQAIKHIHFPETDEDHSSAERRLKFDELFLLQLRAEMIRQKRARSVAKKMPFHEVGIRSFVTSLPFALTPDQKRSAWEILQDVQKEMPMNRLLQGDVGSGKTAVAAIAMEESALSQYASILLAPTEILAEQHFQTLQKLIPSRSIALLTRTKSRLFRSGGDEEMSRNVLFAEIAAGTVNSIVGTHALFTEDLHAPNVGLLIVDEQHRFGVEQRKFLREMEEKVVPHFLSMTATPIPRSLALTLYGDLDVSIIRTMPEGRKPIKTRLVEPRHRSRAMQFVREQVGKGRQVFVICPLIEKSEDGSSGSMQSEKKSVMDEYEKLSKEIFPDLRVDYLHGKLKTKEKDEVMERMTAGKIDVLVSTSVVEVGVNIPNASVMVIEGADRFGLAQLHQFRGRVGRSTHQSYCLVFTDNNNPDVLERLAFFEKTTDGFVLAEYDLARRGPGEVYGTAQSGMSAFRLASLRDTDLIRLAREVAHGIDFDQYPRLRERVEAWEKTVHLE